MGVKTGFQALGVLAMLALATSALQAQSGRVVVANDEWTFSETGFAQAVDTGRCLENVANWFTDGQPGNFLAYSTNFGLTGTSMANTLIAAGHSYTVSAGVTFDVATLATYDAVFLAGDEADNQVLIDYVTAGGSVYLMAGTHDAASIPPDRFNTFLQAFGLRLEDSLNFMTGVFPLASDHPIFDGVSDLYHKNGQILTDLDLANCRNDVITTGNGQDLWMVYDGRPGISFNADPQQVAAGESLNLTTTFAMPGSPAYLIVLEINGAPQFLNLLQGVVGVDCRFHLPATVPPGLTGITATFASLSLSDAGRVSLSNAEVVEFL